MLKFECNFKKGVLYVTEVFRHGCADEITKFVTNHFSHNGEGTLHEDMRKTPEGVRMIAYFDGLEIEV